MMANITINEFFDLVETHAPFLFNYGSIIIVPVSVLFAVLYLRNTSPTLKSSFRTEETQRKLSPTSERTPRTIPTATRRDSPTPSHNSTPNDSRRASEVRRPSDVQDEEGLVFEESSCHRDVHSEASIEYLVPQVLFDSVTYSEDVMLERSKQFYDDMKKRRSVRSFSDKAVPREVVENIIRTAGTSPSGAHTEPWTFAVVSNPATKSQIREIIEDEEKLNYEKRMGVKWVNALKPLGPKWEKPYLETAPYIIVVFKQTYGTDSIGGRIEHYYHEISASISVGFLLAAIQNAGLCTVTTTPLNSGGRLRRLLHRPSNEKVLILLPLGYAAEGATIPLLFRKPLNDVMCLVE